MSRRWLWILLATGLGFAPPAQAQLAVEEVGPNLLQSFVIAAQSTLTAVATAQTVANQILDLEPVSDVVVAAGIAEDLVALADIMRQVEGLSYDVTSLQAQITALFDLDTAPDGTAALKARLIEIRRARWQAYAYAMRLQTLMTTALRTVDHLVTLVNSVATFLGAKQGMQTLVQVNMTISKTLTIHAAQETAMQRGGAIDKMEELLVQASLEKITAARMADWPR